MTQLSPAQLSIIKSQPQSSKLDLIIFQPRTIFQATINGSVSRGSTTIPYTGASGSYTDIENGFTLLIGTTVGGQDIGRIRIKSATATEIEVSENSNIQWSNGLKITVLKYIELWPVYPKIIQDPNNPENVIFYKDGTIVYSGQNSTLGSFICMGPHRPVLLENGTAQVYYTSTGTYNLLGHALTFAWNFEGGTPATSTSATPGYVTYNTAGNYVTRLIVTDAVNGATDTSYRYVAVRNQIGQGSNTPVVRWTMDELSGSRAEGGYSVRFTLFDTVSIDDNAVIMLISKDTYGTNQVSLGGNAENNSQVFFVGYVDKGTIQRDYLHSQVQFNVTSLTGLMKNAIGFSVSVNSVASPSKWYELLDLDVRRAIYHYLRWHTTVLFMSDFQFVGQDYPIQYFDADRTSMYDAIDNLMRGTLVGSLVADRQGKLWAEVDAQAYPNPTASFPSVMQITNQDWMGQPNLEERLADEESYLEYGGIQYSGVVTGTFAAYLACAPGAAPSFRGKVEKLEGLALGGQPQLNRLVGNVWANKNSRYPSFESSMTEDLRNLDIAPQETCRLIINPSDTILNVSLNKIYIPSTMTWHYDSQRLSLLPRITFSNLLDGVDGEAIIIPATPDDGGLNTGFNIPGFRIPNIPAFNPFQSTNVLGAIKFPLTVQTLTGGGFETGLARLLVPEFSVGSVFTYSIATGTFATGITAARNGVYLITARQHGEGTTLGSSNYLQPGIAINGSEATGDKQYTFLNYTTGAVSYDVSAAFSDIFLLNAGDVVSATYRVLCSSITKIESGLSAILLYGF